MQVDSPLSEREEERLVLVDREELEEPVTESAHIATQVLVSGVTAERVMVENQVLNESILGNAFKQGRVVAPAVVGTTIALASVAAATGYTELFTIAASSTGGVVTIAVSASVLGFWLAWKTYVGIWSAKFRKLREMTVWTDYDTVCLAATIAPLTDESDAKAVICRRMLLDQQSLVHDFPKDPTQRAVYGAGHAMVARVHGLWPMNKSVKSVTDMVEWFLPGYNRDLQHYAELKFAFKKPIEKIREVTAEMMALRTQIEELGKVSQSTQSLSVPIVDPFHDSVVVLIGKVGAGRSTLGNLLLHGQFSEDSCEESMSEDESSDEESDSKEEESTPLPTRFDTSDGAEACSETVKVLRSEVEGHTNMMVVDTPGLCDPKGRDRVFQQMVVDSLRGIGQVSCFLLCLNMSERATKEAKERVIDRLAEEYSEEVWKHTILVLTHCAGRRKRKMSESELIGKHWLPYMTRNLPAKVISMDNEEESEFGMMKLEQLFGMIDEMAVKPMKTGHLCSDLSRAQQSFDQKSELLESYKREFLNLAEKDVYVTKSIERKQAVMRGRDEYKSVDLEERVSQCPDLAGLPDTNPLMEQVLKSLKQQTERELEAIHAAVEEVSLIMLEVEKD